MLRESLVVPLRRAVQKAAETDMLVRDEGASIEIDGRTEEVAIEVSPIGGRNGADRYFLIVFDRNAKPGVNRSRVDTPRAAPPEHQAHELQRELAETREYLRTVREEYEAHAEELRAANEEARSANEELQSTNEELGTTKEELQSTNEELTTVNEELNNRNRELAATNSDLRNVLSSVTVAIVMVDHELRVEGLITPPRGCSIWGTSTLGDPLDICVDGSKHLGWRIRSGEFSKR
jgi:two-component system CheB/CheR fusion protein